MLNMLDEGGELLVVVVNGIMTQVNFTCSWEQRGQWYCRSSGAGGLLTCSGEEGNV